MLALARKTEIKNIILEKKSVTVTELSKRFSVSGETIRRDLNQLEAEGVLTKTFGGAYIQGGVENSVNISLRQHIFPESKQAIAARCLELIHNGDSIFLDSSTTSLFVAKSVKSMNLTVTTNSLLIINELCESPTIHLVCIGGNYTPGDNAFNGLNSQTNLSALYFDKTFMSCRSLSMENGITNSIETEAAFRKLLIERSAKVYIVADYSKFNQTSFIHIADFDKITGIITDFDPSEQWLGFLEKHNVAFYHAVPEQN